MVDRVLVIIRVNIKAIDQELYDLERFGDSGLTHIQFRIPKVKVLKRTLKKEQQFVSKPLLFSYGFLELPLAYAKNPLILAQIRERSKVINGFFYKPVRKLRIEQAIAKEEGYTDFHPILVNTITDKELVRLYEVAKTLNVYDTVDQFDVGSFIILQGYPFEGMGAKIKRKKSNGKIQVELVDNGMLVWLEAENVYFSAYNEEDNLSTFT